MMMMSSAELRWQAADADDDDDDDDVDASSLSLRVEIAAVATVDAGTLIMIKNHRLTCRGAGLVCNTCTGNLLHAANTIDSNCSTIIYYHYRRPCSHRLIIIIALRRSVSHDNLLSSNLASRYMSH